MNESQLKNKIRNILKEELSNKSNIKSKNRLNEASSGIRLQFENFIVDNIQKGSTIDLCDSFDIAINRLIDNAGYLDEFEHIGTEIEYLNKTLMKVFESQLTRISELID